MRFTILFIIIGITLTLTTGPMAQVKLPKSPVVIIDSGKVSGLVQEGIESFRGVPFAQPPSGKLRWQPPQQVKKWSGVFNADTDAENCMQEPTPGRSSNWAAGFSEDCLKLNVWRPAGTHKTKKLPVMVWIHGGGFVNGGSARAVYSGEKFARNGVIFVSFNYRLGRFGFFAHSALSKDKLRGNYGLMDQIAALKWVQRNIASFNGDPTNVTVFGESAGGFSVGSLLTTEIAKGLFHKAIIESGGGRLNISPRMDWEKAEKAGKKFALINGIHNADDKKSLAELRRLPAEKVVAGLSMDTMLAQADIYSGPMHDGKVITGEPQDIYNSGNFHHVPLIIGANDADLSFPLPARTVKEALITFGEENFSKAFRAYKSYATTPQAIATAIGSDRMMVEPARFVARIFSKNNIDVWQYRFAYVAESKRDTWPGAVHASEIPYVFNTLTARYGDKVTENDNNVAKQMHQYWVNFASTGKPDTSGTPPWRPYKSTEDNILIIPATGASHTIQLVDPWQKRLDLVEELATQ